MSQAKKDRPGLASEAIHKTTGEVGSIVLHPADADALAMAQDATWLVTVEVNGDRSRRNAYFSLRAAQRAAQRARLRGQRVRVVMSQLTPLYELGGLAQPLLCHDDQNEAGPPGVGSTERALTPSTLIEAEEALA